MNTRWTLDEEKMLIKTIKSGDSLEKLSKELDRSENALELRIKKIIYDNIAENKPISTLSRNLNMPADKIKQYFYSYKDMMDKKGKTTVDIKEQNEINDDNNKNKNKDDILSNIQRHVNKGNDRDKEKDRDKNKDKDKDKQKEMTKIKMQNDKMETILKNIELKNELKKAIKSNKLDKHQIRMFRDVVDK